MSARTAISQRAGSRLVLSSGTRSIVVQTLPGRSYFRSFAVAWPSDEILQQVAAKLPWMYNCVLIDEVKDPVAPRLEISKRLRRVRNFDVGPQQPGGLSLQNSILDQFVALSVIVVIQGRGGVGSGLGPLAVRHRTQDQTV
ncbi:DUF1016 domain-containing protein [Rhizobium laguerreae]|nr:DUF1016 domain-containing protein [Rhizobium laguerreae]